MWVAFHISCSRPSKVINIWILPLEFRYVSGIEGSYVLNYYLNVQSFAKYDILRWGRFSFEYFYFPLSVSLHWCSTLIHPFITYDV